MKRLFIDMDGTLARFYDQAKCVEKMMEPGFFLNLQPYEATVNAVKLLCARDDLRLFVLSTVDGDAARNDKRIWIAEKIGPELPCLFCASGQSKADYVRDSFGGLTEDDYLLDDYSRNLVEWESAGGRGIKFVNELNCRGWNGLNYGGRRIFYDQSPEEMARALLIEACLIQDDRKNAPVSEAVFLRAVDEIMTGKLGWSRNESEWQTDLDYSCRDALPLKALKEIFDSEDPYTRFFELMDEWYCEEEAEIRDKLLSDLRQGLSELGGAFSARRDGRFLNEDAENLFQRLADSGTFLVNYPFEHYLDRKIKVDIMIDTGDSKSAFTDNTVYPHWGCNPESLCHRASIVWLSRTQGYGKKKLERSLFSYRDALDKQGFLPTLGQELVNMPSNVSVLTFLVEMTLRQALELADALREVRNWNLLSNSTLEISKETMCGLYDPWDGGGSLFEIELKKDLYIPLKFIWAAKPDGCVGRYSVTECYGMNSAAWRDTLLRMNIKEDVA